MEVMEAIDEHERRADAKHKRRPPIVRIVRVWTIVIARHHLIRIVRRRINGAAIVVRLLYTPCAVRLATPGPADLLWLAVNFGLAGDLAALLLRLLGLLRRLSELLRVLLVAAGRLVTVR